MKQVNFYQITSSNVVTADIPPRINRNSLLDFRRWIPPIIVNDLINVYLRNPYYKRPILVFGLDGVYVHFDKTFYVVKREIERLLDKWANLAQALSITEVAPLTSSPP
ncbi:hypothetical protein [Thermococcus sp. LS2]|nr:hypothetical protein [Thermococcus sp. LS2]